MNPSTNDRIHSVAKIAKIVDLLLDEGIPAEDALADVALSPGQLRPEARQTEEAMKKQNRFPPGWNDARVQRVLAHYEAQSDAEAVAEDEAAYRSTTTTVMKIPIKLVPTVRALLANVAQVDRREA